ncbi:MULTISPECIES: DeoR/GlpR family DNA-binding transcription regulator [Marinobacter]|uniref:DeoR/GlpR family DNA-binding transcription regulator n=1 Tax=Marinobacter TaxID=2742 RepID=UPI000DAB5E78|nr:MULTISPECIES: DeoR/GlpR family DNA-binding transcription regulator [Marinobacter]
MQLSERQNTILDLLRDKGGVLESGELTDQLHVSVQTIRKDLNELSEYGLVKRVYGGVTLPVQNKNLSFDNRKVINLAEKERIGQLIAGFLPEGVSIFLGIGTTPQQIAQKLIHHPGLTAITNNLNAALALCQNPNITTYCVSGRVRNADQDIVGEDATAYFRKFQVNYGICGVGGISEQGALLDFSPEEAHLTQTLLANCESRLLVADHHKFQRSAPVKSGHLRSIDRFFTDRLPEGLRPLCNEMGVEVIEADAHGENA